MILKVSKDSGAEYRRAWHWSKLISNTKALANTDKEFRNFLAAFIAQIELSEEARLVEQIYQSAKAGDTVTIRLTRRLHSMRQSRIDPDCLQSFLQATNTR